MPFNSVHKTCVFVWTSRQQPSTVQGSTTCHSHYQCRQIICLPIFLCTACVTDTGPSRWQHECLVQRLSYPIQAFLHCWCCICSKGHIRAWQHHFKNNCFSLHLYRVLYTIKYQYLALWQQPSCNHGLPASSIGLLSVGQTEHGSSVVLFPPFIQASHIGFHTQHRKKGLTQTQHSAIPHSRIPLAWLLSRYTALVKSTQATFGSS